MTLKHGIFSLFAVSVATMSAQTPTAVQDIYSQSGETVLKDAVTVAYSVGNWHSGDMDGNTSLWGPLFDQLLSVDGTESVGAVIADADGILLCWNGDDKILTVGCDAEMLGHAAVLIADMAGANRGLVELTSSPEKISLSNLAAGTYAVAVAVDGKLVKSLKIVVK